MPNKNYLSGVRFERTRKKVWEGWGFIVMRSSGSHGCFDLCGFMPGAMAVGIQCKRVQTDKQAQHLLKAFVKTPPMEVSEHFLQVLEVYSQESRKVWNILA